MTGPITRALAEEMTAEVLLKNEPDSRIVDVPERYTGKTYRGSSRVWVRMKKNGFPVLVEVHVSLYTLPEDYQW